MLVGGASGGEKGVSLVLRRRAGGVEEEGGRARGGVGVERGGRSAWGAMKS